MEEQNLYKQRYCGLEARFSKETGDTTHSSYRLNKFTYQKQEQEMHSLIFIPVIQKICTLQMGH